MGVKLVGEANQDMLEMIQKAFQVSCSRLSFAQL